jgi:hypothetical protein
MPPSCVGAFPGKEGWIQVFAGLAGAGVFPLAAFHCMFFPRIGFCHGENLHFHNNAVKAYAGKKHAVKGCAGKDPRTVWLHLAKQ